MILVTGRLLGETPHFPVRNVVVPAYIKDPPQAPLIQCINLSGVGFAYAVTFLVVVTLTV